MKSNAFIKLRGQAISLITIPLLLFSFQNCSSGFNTSGSGVTSSSSTAASDGGGGSVTPPGSGTPVTPPPVTPPTTDPIPGAVSYPGFTYTYPTVRPFISLKPFEGASLTSSAYTTLKSTVDDAVSVTSKLAAGATYDDLISKLNSDHYGFSCVDSIVMYDLSRDPKYLQQAIRMVDLFVASENALIAAGKSPLTAGDSYLEVGDYLEQLALTYDYGFNLLTDSQKTTWRAFADQAMSNIWNYQTATWGGKSFPWTGWATNDPGDNYYYSFMKATQLWSWASQNKTWISFLQQQKYTQLVPYFSVLAGGGSREGTGYGTSLGSLFENYNYWKYSTGEDLSGLSTHARDTIDYWIHATVPTLNYYASIGDQARSSSTAMFDYQRKLMLEAVGLNPGTAQAARGAWWLNHIGVSDGGNGWVYGKMRYNFDYRYDLLSSSQTQTAPTALVYHATGAGALFARSSWSDTAASWLSTVAGPYDQSHAHQDQGSFAFYKNTWLSATPNMLSNSGLHQETTAHNVIRFMNGSTLIPQNNGVSSMSYTDSADQLQIQQDLSPAFSDHSSNVMSWIRNLTYTRSSHSLQVHDQCHVGSGITPVFQIHVPVMPTVSGNVITAGKLKITQSLPAVTASNAPKIIYMPNTDSDFSGGYRIELTGSGCEFVVTLQAQ